MKLYHGSKARFSAFSLPSESGKIRPGEESRYGFRDVIFLSSDKSKAAQYGQYIYTVDVDNPVPYAAAYAAACKVCKGKKSQKNHAKKIAKLAKSGSHIYLARPQEIAVLKIELRKNRKGKT